MPHTPRKIDTDGGVYHVSTRGNNRSFVLDGDEHKQAFKDILARYKKETPFALFHYVVMGNHYHLILQPSPEFPLSEIMQRINHSYSLYFKKRHGFHGQLWQGRFHSELITTDEYLMTCGMYIELNPVRAGITETPEEYRWSSYCYYAYGEIDPLIDTDPIFETLGKTALERQAAYRALTNMWIQHSKGVP